MPNKFLLFLIVLVAGFTENDNNFIFAKGMDSKPQPSIAQDLLRKNNNASAPLAFIENKGQVTDQDHNARPDVQFQLKAATGLNIFIGNGAIHYQFSKCDNPEGQNPPNKIPGAKFPDPKSTPDAQKPISFTMYRMDVELEGANKNAPVVTEQLQDYYENYFTSATGGQCANAHTYKRITYKDIYPHIDWVLYIKGDKLEHEFLVHPGGNVGDIQLKYGGASALKINGDGSLLANTPQGKVTEGVPYAYQKDGGQVACNFRLDKGILSYNAAGHKGELVIDPSLSWATYYGGSTDGDDGLAVATDGSGNVYMTGLTQTSTGIATTGAYQTTFEGSVDAFLAKFNSAGAIQWATYYGGSSVTEGYGVATDGSGNVYITGFTGSSSGIATTGAYQTTLAGVRDAFLAKFSSSGAIQWATYYGGSGGSGATGGDGVATDGSGNVYITGGTYSTTGIATTGAYQTSLAGTQNAFLAQFSSTGAIQWATYYGGSGGPNYGNGVATDGSGNVYMTGQTQSSTGIATTGAYQTILAGYQEAFLARFSSTGAIQWATYYGGSGSSTNDAGNGVATDGSGNVYLTGTTESSTGIATSGAYQTTLAGYQDAFLARFSSTGAIAWGTYYGGSGGTGTGSTNGSGVATDASGNVYITGYTESSTGIATSGAYQTTLVGGDDAFLAQFSSAGAIESATYYGGGSELGYGVAAGSGKVYITGATESSTGIATSGAYQTTLVGVWDVYLAGFSFTNALTFNGGSPQSLTVCENSSGNSINYLLTVTESSLGLTETYSVIATPSHGTVTLGGTVASGTSVSPTGWAYTPVAGYSGTDAFTVQVSDGTLTASTVINVTVNPTPIVTSITGPSVVCPGYSVTLSDATTGGTWSSSNAAVGSVGTTGTVAGITSGTATISYSVTNACGATVVSQIVNVRSFLPPITITPATTATLCIGGSAAFTATVSDTVLNQNFNGAITGWNIYDTMIAPATNAQDQWQPEPDGYHNADEGFTYHSNDNSTFYMANSDTEGFAGGITRTALVSPSFSLAGLGSAQLDFYQYYNEFSSDSDVLVQISTNGGTTWANLANYFPTVGGGAGDVTIGSSTAFTHETISLNAYVGNAACMVRFYYVSNWGWTWAIDNVSVSGTQSFTWAGISGATGLSCSACATTTITPTASGVNIYSVTTSTTGCSETAGVTLTVNPLPVVAAIGGASSVCQSSTTLLNDATGGGVWSSSNIAVGSVSIGGTVTGISAGTTIISYTVSNSCGNTSATLTVTVNNAASLSGATNVCQGSTALLVGSPSGGTWSSSNTAVGTVSSGGAASGITAGTTIITYTYSSGCYGTQTFTVNPLPGTITGTFTVCAGATTTLSSSPTGGTWSSSNGSVATVASGIVSGASAGTATISYTLSTGCLVTKAVTVNTTPTITGANNVCAGSNTTLTGNPTGGAWSSSSSVAPVFAGTVIGASAGTATITYTLSSGCYGTQAFTVNPLPGTITGTFAVCAGAAISLSSSPTGGIWTSSNVAVGTVSSSGSVAGVAAGTTAITYTLSTGCLAKATVTVNVTPSITGANNVCQGGTVTLLGSPGPGVWSSSSAAIGSVSSGGSVSGVSVGSATISYTLSSNGCYSTLPFTVNPLPATILGTNTVCAGFTTLLSDGTPGGTWSTSNGSVATVTSGTVTGVAAGTASITYTLGTGCLANTVVTVIASPTAITPPAAVSICPGATANLADGTPFGIWSSSNNAVATVGTSGTVTSVSSGTATISYTNLSGCAALKTITVNIAPTAISPPSATVCTGSVTSFTDGVGGGVWSSSNGAVATVVAGGSVSGVTTGTATITYSIGICFTTASVTVIGLLNAGSITGLASVCVGNNITLADLAGGGSWSSSNSGVASVGTSGITTGVGAGTAVITYGVTNICGTATATQTVTVNSAADAGTISGADLLCAGSFTVYSDAVPGGTWSVSNATATIGTTGFLTGISPGTNTISYTVTNSCGLTSATETITVGTYLSGGTITGTMTNECVGSSLIVLSDIAPGGVWSASNGTATVSGGTVTGISGGVDTISYTVSSSCGSASAIYTVTITPTGAGTITGPLNICIGSPVTYTDPLSGGIWSLSNTSAFVGSGGLVTPTSTGSNIITYSVTNVCGSSSTTQTINIGPYLTAGSISGGSGVCVGSSITLIDTTGGGVWSASNTNATVSGGVVAGLTAGTTVISYAVTASCGTAIATQIVTVSPLPVTGGITGASSVCIGSTATYTDGASGGTWSIDNVAASISAGGVVTPLSAGTDTVIYTVTNACGAAHDQEVINIIALPSAGSISGLGVVCIGIPVMLTDGISGGAWSALNANATVSSVGIVNGLATGTDVISYSVTNSCGTAIATQSVTVNAALDAGTIVGPSSVCLGTPVAYTDAAPGGSWSSSNASAAISGAGLLTPLVAGATDTVIYTVSAACGAATATEIVSVNTLPSAGSISGAGDICIGSPIAFTDGIAGGIWSSSDVAVATAGSVSGLVTGIASGTSLIDYTVTNACGTSVTSATVLVIPGPDAGAITGASEVCIGSTITLSDAAVGGVWSAGNIDATVSGGAVSGVSGGVDPISYSVTNSCGTASAVLTVTVNTFPLVDSVSGLETSICIGSEITLTDPTPGGAWSATNTAATVSGGLVSGVSAGVDTVIYSVSNACATVAAIKIITVSTTPNAGTISGASMVCVGAMVTLSDGVPGGTWSSSDTKATVSGGVVTGVAPGTDTIRYAASNGCGLATTTKVITIDPKPEAGIISGSSSVCPGLRTTLTDTVSGGVWSSANTAVATVAGGVVTGVTTGIVDINYTVSNSCGSAAAIHSLTVLTPGDCNTGVNNVLNGNSGLKVYPNPNPGAFTMNLVSDNDEAVHVTITDVLGRKIQEFTTVTNKETDIKIPQAAGIYLLSATTEAGKYMAKVTVE